MTRPSWETEEIVNFPVPKRLLPVVIQVLAREINEDSRSPSSPIQTPITPGHEIADRKTIQWDNPATCRKLRDELTAPGALLMLDVAAEHPGVPITFPDVVNVSGYPASKVRGDLVALTKAIKRGWNVDREHAEWPVDFKWDDQACYTMSQEVARAWKESAEG